MFQEEQKEGNYLHYLCLEYHGKGNWIVELGMTGGAFRRVLHGSVGVGTENKGEINI